ncbi:OmpA family protein [Pseudomonas sp. M30-35]|uniref:OmpA family protein n=1 Tax=Pseudomonas sp. M30-35 TaxID=1981174 RepID=UPI000B3C2A16|nr:OmpA family protein [Pseudomonas sp. M30-35]ARU90157.1 hypothetical protein B9K09_20355 [Pseudomonas sp. M30-35]
MLKLRQKNLFLMLATGLVCQVAVAAENTVLKNDYQMVPDVDKNQAQIVYFRTNSTEAAKQNSNIYVDGEFHTALIPGSYTAFCVKPGSHIIGSWLGDAPLYQGKQDKKNTITLEGGKTYYLRAAESNQNTLNVTQEREATPLLMKTRLQDLLFSRASAVTECQYQYKDYVLASDVMFEFGKSGINSISGDGREALAEIAKDLNQGASSKVVVIGHTDPIGSTKSNLALGLKRAETVRSLLLNAGVNENSVDVSTVGSSEPVASNCENLSRSNKISCYAPDRRVVVRSYAK